MKQSFNTLNLIAAKTKAVMKVLKVNLFFVTFCANYTLGAIYIASGTNSILKDSEFERATTQNSQTFDMSFTLLYRALERRFPNNKEKVLLMVQFFNICFYDNFN